MNFKYLIFAFLLSQISYSRLPSCRKTQYSYYTLALTWVNQFCSIKKCNSQKDQFMGEGQKQLTIHGFWPSSNNLAYLSCLIQNQKDYYCFTDFKFNQNLFSSEDIDDLRQYWPDLADNNFWQYEWNKHGTCYLNIIKQQKKSSLSQEQIFRDYFVGTVEKVKQLNIKLTAPLQIETKNDLADLMNLDPSQFHAICSKQGNLSQVRICYDINSQPKKQKLTACPISTDRSLCVFPISLPA